jgi:hypothetical protein
LLPVLFVPKRRWGRATWLPSALVSAGFAAALTHELLLLPRPFASHTRILMLLFFAAGSALYAVAALVEAVRGSKDGAHQAQPATSP